jgi:hypothetical protein
MRIETVGLRTDDGLRLDADVARADAPTGAAVITHPHPLYGGNRHHPVVGALYSALARAGWTVVRFDFRGVGASEGRHGGGADERTDVLAGVDLLAVEVPGVPVWLLGYSFGAAVELNVGDDRVAGWVGVAPPLGVLPGSPVAAADARPKLLLVPEHDQYTSPAATVELTREWPATTVEVVPMADHFLNGHADRVAERTLTWLHEH